MLAVSVVAAVGFGLYGNAKRHREAFERWAAPIRKRPPSGPTKEYTDYVIKTRAARALEDDQARKVLRRIVEDGRNLKSKPDLSNVDWEHLQRRSESLRSRRKEMRKKAPGNAPNKQDYELAYEYFEELKTLGDLYQPLFGEKVENPDLEGELDRLETRERVKDGVPYGSNTEDFFQAAFWCEKNGVPLDDFLREIAEEGRDLEAARKFHDEEFHPEIPRESLENDFKNARNKMDSELGRKLSLEEFLMLLRTNIYARKRN